MDEPIEEPSVEAPGEADAELRPRRRRRSSGLERRLRTWWPLALVTCASLLSAGVVRLMEIRPAATQREPRAEAPARLPAAKGQRPPNAMLWSGVPEAKQPAPLDPASLERERRATLRESFLRLDLDSRPAPEPQSEPALETGPERDLRWMRESKLEAVPEPGSFVLVAIGVAALSARRRGYWRISSSSTSKTRTAPGGIRPAPRSP